MNEKEYISVAEFARRGGVTPQAIYPRLDKDLKSFVKVINGRKSLNIKALELFNVKTLETGFKPLDNDLTSILQVLENQLAVKDKQIDQLNDRLQEASARLQEAGVRLQEANQLNHQNQILLDKQQQEPDKPEMMEQKPGLLQRFMERLKR